MANILVIEDNDANLELMTYLLRANGQEVTTATDGEAGVRRAAEPGVDLVISDVHLPRVDGYEVARRIRADPRLQHLPLIAVTALAMVGDKDKVMAAGFDGYISKPINPREFVSQVAAYIPSGAAPGGQQMAAAPNTACQPPAAVANTAGAGKRILVVDDSPANRDLAKATLEPFGYEVVATSHMADAMALLAKESFDLVMSDVHMPDGTGYEFLHAVKANTRLKEIPFVLISSTLWGARERERGLGLGASQVLLRPLAPRQLLEEVASLLAGSGDALNDQPR